MEHNRRVTDLQQEKINELIEKEDDPKDRAFLIVLQQINSSLIANTETINGVAQKLDTHLTAYEQHAVAEEARLNKGRGAWKVIVWFLGLAQVLLLAAISAAYNDVRSIHAQLVLHDTRIANCEVTHKGAGK